MSDVLIKNLDAAETVNEDDVLIIEQNETKTCKATVAQVLGDYILEQKTVTGTDASALIKGGGANASCTYRKWASGVLEIWGCKTVNNIVPKTAFLGGYLSVVQHTTTEQYTRVDPWGTYPVPFVGTPPHVDYQLVDSTGTSASDYSIGEYVLIGSMYGYNDSSPFSPLTETPSFRVLFASTSKLLSSPRVTFRAVGKWK